MPRTVLIVDDNAMNRLLLRNTLRKEYNILEAANGRNALETMRLHVKALSAVLLDIQMPVMDGYETLKQIRDDVELSPIPIIMVTGSEDEESRVKALSLGANDFILKPFNPEIVKHCVRNNIALRETASTLNAIQRDKLTGLYNREAFFDKVAAAVKEKEPGYYLLSCFDIDHFKLINDRFGAVEGDRILRDVGKIVRADMEMVGGVGGRVSGDNFAVLLPVSREEMSITRIIRENRMAFSQRQAIVFSVGRYIVTDPSLPASAIYDRVYIAKQSVKGRYDKHIAYFDDAMLDRLIRDQQIIADMDTAVAEHQFEVWFQPQRNHSSGSLIGAEALVRWRHPERGLIPPGDFIPIFEQNGFIYELDKYVWEETCRCLRKWITEGSNPAPVSVNLSRYDIFRSDLIEVLTGLIHRYEIPVDLLRLEITESAFAKSTGMIVKIVEELVEKGFTVEIDDFGSGYSSLNTLKSVPAQIVKLDMRFLEDDGGSGRGGNILESIVRMTKWLGMSVIAEGVEEKAQADYLTSVGCNYIQGYYYARPMPVPEYEAYCRTVNKDERLLTMEAVDNLDNNSFWDPKSMDTLIFNSFVGAACIFEYHNRHIELLRVNSKFTAILGDGTLSVEDTLKLDWITHLTPEGLVQVRDILKRSGETGEEYPGEYEFHDIGGLGVTTCLRSTMRVIARAGERLLVYCTSENITAQRRAERELEKTMAQLRVLNDSIPGGLASYVVSKDSIKIEYCNDGYIQLFGGTREGYAKRERIDPIAWVFEEDRPALLGQLQSLVEDNAPMDGVFRIHTLDGGYKWINQRAVAAERREGEVRFNAVLLDVTRRENALEQLRISEEANRLAIRHSRTVVCRYDVASGTLELPAEVNPIFETPRVERDVPEAQVRNGNISLQTTEAFVRFFGNIRRGEKSGEVLYQRRSTEGWRWVEGFFSTIFSNTGKPVSAVVSFADVTERLEREAVYRKWQQSLLGREPKTYMLYRGNVSKNTPFDSVEGGLITIALPRDLASFDQQIAYYASHQVEPQDREEYLETLKSEALMARYYRGERTGVLEYREITAQGQYRWLRCTMELVEYPNSSDIKAYLLYEDIDTAKRTELSIIRQAETDPLTGLYNRKTFREKVDKLVGDKGRECFALFMIDLDGFKQVNDCFGHAMGDETIIEMSWKLRDAFRERDYICRWGGDEFMVLMRGVHRREAVHDRAALVCSLLHKSFSEEVQLSASVGIALYPDDGEDFDSLYREADVALYHVKNGGKDSYALYTDGMGGMAAQPAAADPPADSPASDDDDGVYRTPRRRMLIVEDNEINRDFLAGLFDDSFVADTAANGIEALDRLRRLGAGISIVLLDLNMPGMDGFAVLDQMRQDPVMRSVPVIVVSGVNERETSLEAIRHGASDYVSKPIDGELLQLRVASALSRAENERLQAQNRYLALQCEETKRLAEAKKHSQELSLALHAAERADLAKTQFLSSMSHEIRTPLNAVIGYNCLARDEMAAAHSEEERRQAEMKAMDWLTKSEIASRHLMMIVNDVLDMSAIESGKMRVNNEPFDFRSLISSLSVMFYSQARAKGVNFEVLFEKPTEEWFIGDQLRINQVLTNLLSNAVKFTPENGSVTLSIREKEAAEDCVRFRFLVSDTGIGMTKEYLEHIWMPFEQAESSISRRFGGTGLGLSITKNLVELMGGTIRVESESGKGSTFSVELTLRRTPQQGRAKSSDFSGVNALVADDDPGTCDYIKLLFDRCGAKCETFLSGRKAVAAFSAARDAGRPFNVCLVDWRMPDMDGFETISEIRRIAGRETPIVVVTAYDFSQVAKQAETLSINQFLSKPLFQSTLYDLLANICGRPMSTAKSREAKHDFRGAKVLLVEDNKMNMEVARRTLAAVNLTVDAAWNGREAVDKFAASQPGTYGAILMDIHMPEMDGYQAARQIRALDRPDARTVPVIAMTADVFSADIAEARSAGMDDHISKPVDRERLYAMLTRYIGGR